MDRAIKRLNETERRIWQIIHAGLLDCDSQREQVVLANALKEVRFALEEEAKDYPEEGTDFEAEVAYHSSKGPFRFFWEDDLEEYVQQRIREAGFDDADTNWLIKTADALLEVYERIYPTSGVKAWRKEYQAHLRAEESQLSRPYGDEANG